MGLDMYMKMKSKTTGKTINSEVAYWRKANQIRNWIVRNTDYPEDGNLIDFPLTKNDLESLLSDCKRVLLDHSLAPELLPTQSGFFFGSIEYDDFYYEELESTIEKIEDILNMTDFETQEIYYIEWW